ncbi:hypothetical protein PVK06_036595 [Gossypium arboreum]|uniref:RNase H type-1 domain-containing protein n=1 Tax=Gossypium arboreum TaxID=29729 RepID=A0ABR0NN36_GOSAR|nr:hypothetical protein PVK06_036595 [Gossypium arboreum]
MGGTTSVMIQFDATFDNRNSRSASVSVFRIKWVSLKPQRRLFIITSHPRSQQKLMQSKRTSIQEISFQFIHRSENTRAHKLAKEALAKLAYLVREALNHSDLAPKGRWRIRLN